MKRVTYFCNFHCNGTSWARPMEYSSKRAAIKSVKATAAGEADLVGAKCSVEVWTVRDGAEDCVYFATRKAGAKRFRESFDY